MKKERMVLMVVMFMILTGCGKTTFRHSVVSRITVEQGGQTNTYTTQGEMIQILDLLRNLGQRTHAQINPETLSIPSCRIMLERTDGTATVYQIKGERYIRRDNGSWQQTAPQGLTDLLVLLGQLSTAA